jgi:hypothetical protein
MVLSQRLLVWTEQMVVIGFISALQALHKLLVSMDWLALLEGECLQHF